MMCRIYRSVCLLFLLAAGGIAFPLNAEKIIDYQFSGHDGGRITNLVSGKYHGKIKGAVQFQELQGRNMVVLDGKRAGLEIADSENMNASDSLSLEATVRFQDVPTENMQREFFNQRYDAIFYKHNQFVFSRRGGRFYCNFHDGKNWTAQMLTSPDLNLQKNQFYHVVLVFHHHNEPSQGNVWTKMVLYLNGKAVVSKQIPFAHPARRKALMEIGKADKFGSGWNFHGEIAKIAVYNQSLEAHQVQQLTLKETLVKPDFALPYVPSVQFQKKLKTLLVKLDADKENWQNRVLPETISNLVLSLRNQREGMTILDRIVSGENKLDGRSGQVAGTSLWLLKSGPTVLAFAYDANQKKFCLSGLFDLKSSTQFLSYECGLWELTLAMSGKSMQVMNSLSQKVRAHLVKPPVREGETWTFTVQWDCLVGVSGKKIGTVLSDFSFKKGRLDYDLRVSLNDASDRLTQVEYPLLYLKELPGKDILLTPCGSGVERSEPVENECHYMGEYPSGTCSLQMGAYYNQKTGIYFAMEDPLASSKKMCFASIGHALKITGSWMPGYVLGRKDSFDSGCRSVVQIYPGGWYEAGLLYRRWLEQSGVSWWIKELPRKDSPVWFRNNLMWIRGRVKSFEDIRKTIDYLKMPFAIHLYNWHGIFDDDYPHYNIKKEVLEEQYRYQKAGVRIVPYINGRLWDTRDKGEKDWFYSSLGEPNTIKNSDGIPMYECYRGRQFGVMCPAASLWQKTVYDNIEKILSWGFDGVYLDQVAAARPSPCYDLHHGHRLADCRMWLRDGYWKMFEEIRKMAAFRSPGAVLTSEDNAEPYSHCMDGFLPWRWMFDGQVPLFVMIYSGRVQFTGLNYGAEEVAAQPVMLASQLVNGEQLGWLGMNWFWNKRYQLYRKLIKNFMAVRMSMLPFFNEGMMDYPVLFQKQETFITRKWGNHGTGYVTSPVIKSSAWKLKDGSAFLLVNTTGENQKQDILFNSAQRGFENEKIVMTSYRRNRQEESVRQGDFSIPVDLEPYEAQILLFEHEQGKMEQVKKQMKACFKD